jgi:hypothetical protein
LSPLGGLVSDIAKQGVVEPHLQAMGTTTRARRCSSHTQLLRIWRGQKASLGRRFSKKRRSHDVCPGSPVMAESKPRPSQASQTTLGRRSDDGRLRAWRHL